MSITEIFILFFKFQAKEKKQDGEERLTSTQQRSNSFSQASSTSVSAESVRRTTTSTLPEAAEAEEVRGVNLEDARATFFKSMMESSEKQSSSSSAHRLGTSILPAAAGKHAPVRLNSIKGMFVYI